MVYVGVRAQPTPLHNTAPLLAFDLFSVDSFYTKNDLASYAPGRTHSKEMVLPCSLREPWTEFVTINEHALLAV